MKKIHSKKAFTLVELLIAILIIAASWSIAATLTPKGQTAQREAERLAMLLEKTMSQAMRIHDDFELKVDMINKNVQNIYINFDKIKSDDIFITAMKDCYYNFNKNNLQYSAKHGTMTGVSIIVTGADEKERKVKISVQGRVKIYKPSDSEY